MVIVAVGAVLAGSLPAALGGLDGVASAGMGHFLLGPKLDGTIVVACSGLSPVTNACAVPFAGCVTGCAPAITGTLGYTGTITATIRGFDNNRPPLPVYVSETCQYVAGNRGDVGGAVHLGACSYGTDAPYLCPGGKCGYYMQGPFTLEGLASLPLAPVARPVGPWLVEVVSA
jgi:hypothetical protein